MADPIRIGKDILCEAGQTSPVGRYAGLVWLVRPETRDAEQQAKLRGAWREGDIVAQMFKKKGIIHSIVVRLSAENAGGGREVKQAGRKPGFRTEYKNADRRIRGVSI